MIDEPSAGLHPTDVTRTTEVLLGLRDAGNTVLVVEHDRRVMACADRIIEIGPGGGSDGGRLVFEGEYADLLAADTATGRGSAGGIVELKVPRSATGRIPIVGASRNNLRDVDVEIGQGILTVLTGVAGSGKSSLAAEIVGRHDAVVVDQRPVSTNRRSTPITYTGIGQVLRKLFAAASGLPQSLFSANSDGACPECDGLGIVYTDLAFMEGQESVCEACDGLRFRPAALQYTVGGYSIAEVERLTVAEAISALNAKPVTNRLRHLDEVGLGYLRLGQSLSTLSGGEAQRVKIARELRERTAATLYVLDEPTAGLHRRDVTVLMQVLDRLVDEGHTVVVIEHDMQVAARADRLIDLGPGAGDRGGSVLYDGAVAGYLGRDTPTSRALTELLSDST